jgi:hypothetical protein
VLFFSVHFLHHPCDMCFYRACVFDAIQAPSLHCLRLANLIYCSTQDYSQIRSLQLVRDPLIHLRWHLNQTNGLPPFDDDSPETKPLLSPTGLRDHPSKSPGHTHLQNAKRFLHLLDSLEHQLRSLLFHCAISVRFGSNHYI